MARLGIQTGIAPNDGNGDTLLTGAIKINDNFSEIYSAIGDGNSLNLEVTSASPIQISLSGSTLTFNVVGIGSTTLNLA
jgi:hypothetical protein